MQLLFGGDSANETKNLADQTNSLQNVLFISVQASPTPCRFYVQYCDDLTKTNWVDVNPNGYTTSTSDVTVVSHTNNAPRAFYRASSRRAK